MLVIWIIHKNFVFYSIRIIIRTISKYMIFIPYSVVFYRLIFALIRTYENPISALKCTYGKRTCTHLHLPKIGKCVELWFRLSSGHILPGL